MQTLFLCASVSIYIALAMIAVWGAFCVIVVWRRVAQTRFSSEEEQDSFLDKIDESLESADFEAAAELCEEDDRATPQLALLAISNRQIGYAKVRTMVSDRFQRDVLSDLEFRLSWVYTVIKSAPMVGLLGTVVGMMGAFAKIAGAKAEKVNPTNLADDISFALVTTACGLAIAIPLVLCTASRNARIRNMEGLVSYGMSRSLETLKSAMGKTRGGEK